MRLVFTGLSNSGTVDLYLIINSDTGSNYSNTRINGQGTTASSASNTSESTPYDTRGWTLGTSNPSMVQYDIFSYAGSTYKTYFVSVSNDQNGSGNVTRFVRLWRSTSAITTLAFTASGNMAAGSTATLYGILKA